MAEYGHVTDRELTESDIREAIEHSDCFEGFLQLKKSRDCISLTPLRNPFRFAARLVPTAACLIALFGIALAWAYLNRGWRPWSVPWMLYVSGPALFIGALALWNRRYFVSGSRAFLKWFGQHHRIEVPTKNLKIDPAYPVGFEEFLVQSRHDLSDDIDSRRQLWLHVLDDDDRAHRIHLLTWNPETWLVFEYKNDGVLEKTRDATGIPMRRFTFRDGHRIEVLDESMF